QIYAGPQGSFVPKSWGGGQNLLATAELGFVLVQIDGMGTNNRSKAFHDVAWKNLGDAGFADRILWHKAVAARYPWYDASRVGVYGTSAGGQNAAGAVLFHPEFYDAAFASSGCHDNRMDKIWWNEQWMGELGPHYEASSNIVNAQRLKGHLFLAVGEMDTNVDPSSTMQFVDALIRAGKDFDLLVVPNGGHGATGPDGIRRRNDFFVHWLLGVNPPDWNSGATIAAHVPNRDVGARDDGPPAVGFFDDPNHDVPAYWWW
ncbi:MAG TPA: prolyl oligopeptidase family serine peptidase, partial [Longimicrobiales bacterium]